MATILTVNGRTPAVPEDAFVAANVVLAGDVQLAPGASVWFGAVLRAETEPIRIDADTNLQDGVVVHTDPGYAVAVGERVTVGHRAVLHGCRVDDDALIGIGAVVMSGAHIGEGAVVGAGAVVVEGTVVAPRTVVVGVPARVLDRPVPDVPRPNVQTYVEVAAMYREAGA